jgi:hypothetical protein
VAATFAAFTLAPSVAAEAARSLFLRLARRVVDRAAEAGGGREYAGAELRAALGA